MHYSKTHSHSKYHIVYQITNLINGKSYIGAHTTNNLVDGYMGSGFAIKSAIKKYGIDNFTKVILEQFDNAADMYSFEKSIVTEQFISSDDNYNLRQGGSGWGDGNTIAKEACDRFKYLVKNDLSFRAKRSAKISAALKTFIQKNGTTSSKRRWMSNDFLQETKYILKENTASYEADGWYFGKTYHNHRSHLKN